MKRIREWLDDWSIALIYVAVIAVIGFAGYASSATDSVVTYDDCTTESIPYETTEVGDTDDQDAETETEVEGVDGEKEICEPSKEGYDDKVTVTKEPITEVIRYTSQPEEIDEEPAYTYQGSGSYRTGAICSDGSTSSATGRGACSWHGGVSEWLY